MSKSLPYLIFVIVLLLTPYAKSQEVTSGEQPSSETVSQSQSDSDSGAQPTAATQAEPPASSADGTASSGSDQQGTQQGEASGKEGSTEKNKTKQDAGQAASDQSAAPATQEKPAAETTGSQAETAKPAEEPQPESEASQALKASKEEEEKQKATVTEVVEQAGGGLISGKFQLNFSESYSHSDNSRLYINGFGVLPIVIVGDVNVQRLRRDTFTTTITASYKLTNTMQVSLSVPYQYMTAHTANATGIRGNNPVSANEDTVTTNSEMGDISTSLSYAFLRETIGRPGVNLSLSFKARNARDSFETPDPVANPPVGSGFYSLRGSVSVNKSTAPAVLFGSMAYVYNFKRNDILYTPKGRNPSIIDSYQAGPGLSFSEGVGLSLNYELSLNWSFGQSINFPAKLNGNDVSNSRTVGLSFTMGGTYRISNAHSVSLSFTQGLSSDSGGFTMSVGVPWRF